MSEKEQKIKLMRAPIDLNCANPECKKSLAFGTWVYYNSQTQEAICPECAVKRGWTPKRRAKQLIKGLELLADLKALKREVKIEAAKLMRLKQEIDIHALGKRDTDLEKQAFTLTNLAQDYLRHCGTEKETEMFNNVNAAIRKNQELQLEIREELGNRLFIITAEEKRKQKRRREKRQAIVD